MNLLKKTRAELRDMIYEGARRVDMVNAKLHRSQELNEDLRKEIRILNKHNVSLIETVAHQKRTIESQNKMVELLSKSVKAPPSGVVYKSPTVEQEERAFSDQLMTDFFKEIHK